MSRGIDDETQAVPLQLRLRMALPALRTIERQIVNALLARLDEVPTLGIVEVARLAAVSEGSVQRLCRSLGFSGYTSFKIQLVTDLATASAQPHPIAISDVSDDIGRDDDIATITRKIFRADMQILADTLLVVSTELVGRAVQTLVAATRVEIFGVGGSSLIAQDAAFRLLRAGVDAIATVDTHMQAIRVSLLTPADVAIAISYSGETPDTIETFMVAAQTGAKTIAITGMPDSTLARHADIALVTAAPDASWQREAIPTRIAQLALIETICAALTMRKEAAALQNLQKIESALQDKRQKRRQP